MLPVRVYLEDTDAQGVVYNASYFRFMERARTERLRDCGIDHDRLREEHDVMLVLSGVAARFKVPARLGDLLHVSADVAAVKGARIVFEQCIRRDGPDGEIVCDGRAEVACTDAGAHRPRRIPEVIRRELAR